MKQDLSKSIVDKQLDSKASFSREELRDIFCLEEGTLCNTHDLIDCNCDGSAPSKVLHSHVTLILGSRSIVEPEEEITEEGRVRSGRVDTRLHTIEIPGTHTLLCAAQLSHTFFQDPCLVTAVESKEVDAPTVTCVFSHCAGGPQHNAVQESVNTELDFLLPCTPTTPIIETEEGAKEEEEEEDEHGVEGEGEKEEESED